MKNKCKLRTLQIRDLPQDIYEKLAHSAELSRRSMTQEAIVLLEKGLKVDNSVNLKEDTMARIKKGLKPTAASQEEIIAVIRADRTTK